MKSIRTYFFCLTMLSLFVICFGSQSFGQERLNLSAGIGFPEYLNLGARYQLKQSQIAIGYGFTTSSDNGSYSLTGEYFLHLHGTSDFSKRRPWYARTGVTYMHDESEFFIRNVVWLSSRLGREFNVSKKLGMQIDLGAMYMLYFDSKTKKPGGGWDLVNILPIWPSFGLGVFYRF